MSATATNYVPIKSICQKQILEQAQPLQRTDDSITKVWSKTGSLSYHYRDLWAAVKLPKNIQIGPFLTTGYYTPLLIIIP